MNLQNAQEQVREFMTKAGQGCPDRPTVPDLETMSLRIRLHQEEAVEELDEAFCKNDLVGIADSIADSLVVILGTAVACGLSIEPVFNEVMRSNMTKFVDGYRDPGGKWIKGPSYDPANLAPIVAAQNVPQR